VTLNDGILPVILICATKDAFSETLILAVIVQKDDVASLPLAKVKAREPA